MPRPPTALSSARLGEANLGLNRMGAPALDSGPGCVPRYWWFGGKPDQKEGNVMAIKTKDIDRTIGAVAKLGLFCMGELKLTEDQLDGLWDQITEFLGEVNDEKYRLEPGRMAE